MDDKINNWNCTVKQPVLSGWSQQVNTNPKVMPQQHQ